MPRAHGSGLESAGQVAASSQVLLVVDDDCICVEASLGAGRVLAAGRNDLVGRNLGELLEPASRERLNVRWPQARGAGGRLGSFALAPPASVDVDATVTRDLLPGRHLIALEAAAVEPVVNGSRRFSAPAPGRAPTAREREVLDLLADGATDEQIATRLKLSPATVQTHVRNAKSKLGARTRAQAVALALHRGLIGSAPSESV